MCARQKKNRDTTLNNANIEFLTPGFRRLSHSGPDDAHLECQGQLVISCYKRNNNNNKGYTYLTH